MRRRGLGLLAVLGVTMLAGCDSNSPARPPAKSRSPAAAFASRARPVLGGRPEIVRCERPSYDRQHVLCGAVLHHGARYREVFGTTLAPPAPPVFTNFGGEAWTRRWRLFPPRAARMVATSFRGSAWINAPADTQDWEWLIGEVAAASTRLPTV